MSDVVADIIVRAYAGSDEPRIRQIAVRLTEGFAPWRSPSKVESTVTSWIDSALAQHDASGRAVFVADDGDGAVGFISVTARDHYIDGRDADIGELAVDERCEGRGVGSLLIAAATEWAHQQGCERLTLQTGAANRRARAFYERLGFEYEDVSLARPVPPDVRPVDGDTSATG